MRKTNSLHCFLSSLFGVPISANKKSALKIDRNSEVHSEI
jgi:hypothetical protein